MTHTNPFAPDPQNPATRLSSQELEERADAARKDPHAMGPSVPAGDPELEELARREDVATAVELWERLCAVPFVRGETQGHYTHSTAHLSPEAEGRNSLGASVQRMPNREELEALVLSDGEETAYPAYEFQDGSAIYQRDTNPWSDDGRLYPITLTLISCGDYHGSDVDAANNRALKDTPGVEYWEPNTGGQSSVFNVTTVGVGEMSTFMNETEREPAARRADALMWLESLVKTMEGLLDYALLDEEKHSELIEELAEEAWDSWLESDVTMELENLSPEEDWCLCHAPDELKASVREVYYSFEENEWTVSSLGEGATNGRHREAVKHVARTVFGWNVP